MEQAPFLEANSLRLLGTRMLKNLLLHCILIDMNSEHIRRNYFLSPIFNSKLSFKWFLLHRFSETSQLFHAFSL